MLANKLSLLTPAPVASPDYASLQQAASWYAALLAEDASELDRSRWRTWLAERPEHLSAWQHIEAVSRRFAPLQADHSRLPAAAALKAAQSSRQPGLSRRQAFNGMAGIAAAGLFGWAVWRQTDLPEMVMALAADYSTKTGEVREFALADGTQMWLNTGSAANADYSTSLRRIKLVSGEAMFQTAADALRPFTVDSNEGRMRALGTRFSVRQLEGSTQLSVYEGAVEICTAASQSLQLVNAGEQASFTSASISRVSPVQPARQAWSRGVLLADDITLGALVAELGRYRKGYLNVSPAIAGLHVMGAYPLNDTDRALAMLEDALPVKVQRTLSWWVTLEPRTV